MNWAKWRRAKRFGEPLALTDIVSQANGATGSYGGQMDPTQAMPEGQEKVETFNLPSSEDYGDPTIAQVITWHISLCLLCQTDLNKVPEPFGVKSRRYCPEYWEIFQEYSEYEAKYALRGNP